MDDELQLLMKFEPHDELSSEALVIVVVIF